MAKNDKREPEHMATADDRKGAELELAATDPRSEEEHVEAEAVFFAQILEGAGSDDQLAAPLVPADGVFPPAPIIKDEFTLPLDQLVVGANHPRKSYDFETGVGKALFHAALDPAVLAPIVLMLIENIWYVIDGWARVLALRLQHEDDPAVLVRVVQWTGTEKEAVYKRFSQTFLALGSKPIDFARQLARMSELWGVPDVVLGARIGWTKSKVSKHLTAAEGERDEPRFATLLRNPANPSIDYMYRVGKAWRDAVEEDARHPKRSLTKGSAIGLRKRLDTLLARKERFEPKDALVALGLAKAKPEPELPFGAPFDQAGPAPGQPTVLEDVVGHDDVVVGALGMHGDGGRRLLLPADTVVAEMTPVEKASAKSAYHEAIDRLFG